MESAETKSATASLVRKIYFKKLADFTSEDCSVNMKTDLTKGFSLKDTLTYSGVAFLVGMIAGKPFSACLGGHV